MENYVTAQYEKKDATVMWIHIASVKPSIDLLIFLLWSRSNYSQISIQVSLNVTIKDKNLKGEKLSML